MGTPEFARVCLASLEQAGYPILGVVTQPSRPAGRGQAVLPPPCAAYAKEKGFLLFQPTQIKNNEEFLKKVEALAPDFIVVVAYGRLLPARILAASRIDTINLHASLLPKYRGAAPINWAIINGDTTTGVSVMKVTEKMDAGPVYSQKILSIAQTDTAGDLFKKLADLGAELLLETLPKIADGSLKPILQDETKVTIAPLLKKEEGKLDWNQPASLLFNRIRGLNPWPGAHTSIDNKVLKIYHASLLNEKPKNSPGTVYFLNEQGINVACADSALCLTEVQLEGKKKMSASEFVRGYRLKVGALLAAPFTKK